MGRAASITVEFRHNEEPLGRIHPDGALELHDDEHVCHAEARFWHGARGLGRHYSGVPLFRPLLPRPRRDFVLFVVR